jgi:sugar lactone lactonase YvrE
MKQPCLCPDTGNALALNDGAPASRGDIWFSDKAQQVETLAACLHNTLKAMATAAANRAGAWSVPCGTQDSKTCCGIERSCPLGPIYRW